MLLSWEPVSFVNLFMITAKGTDGDSDGKKGLEDVHVGKCDCLGSKRALLQPGVPCL